MLASHPRGKGCESVTAKCKTVCSPFPEHSRGIVGQRQRGELRPTATYRNVTGWVQDCRSAVRSVIARQHDPGSLAPGLTPRSVLDKMAAIQMVDVHLPTTDGRTVILSRYTGPEPDQALLLQRLKISLPDQPPPRITSDGVPALQ